MLPCDDDISFSYLKQAGRTVAQSFLQRPDFRPEIFLGREELQLTFSSFLLSWHLVLYKVLYAETDVK